MVFRKQLLLRLTNVIPIAESLLQHLRNSRVIQQVEIAGSYRRRKETIADLDILVTAPEARAAIKHFMQYLENGEVFAKGPTRATVRLRSGIQVDLRAVAQKSYGAALIYFTSSKAHNIKRGIFLEVNAQPERLDLAATYCKMAKDIGVKLAISTDAHTANQFDFMQYGIFQARRGWLEPDDVINTRSLSELKKLLHRPAL